MVKKADALIKEGKLDEAIVTYERAIQENPKEITFYLNQAAIYRQKKMYKRSLRYYEAAALLNTENPLPLIGQARLAILLGDLVTAKTKLDEALKLSPNFAPAYFFLGHIYQQQNNGNQAVFYYNLAFDGKFDPLLVYYQRGQVYEKLLSAKDQARADYQAYINGNGKKVDEVKIWLAGLDKTVLPATSTMTSTATGTQISNPFDF